MSHEEAAFGVLMSRVRDGSQEAAWELIGEYGDLVLRVVRKRLPHELRRAFDSADFVQVAWGTIFRHRSRLCRFDKPTEFVSYLAAVAANKVRTEIRRRLQQQKYNVNREQPLDQAEHSVVAAVPTPSQVAIGANSGFAYWKTNRPTIRKSSGCDSRDIRRVRLPGDWDWMKGPSGACCESYSET